MLTMDWAAGLGCRPAPTGLARAARTGGDGLSGWVPGVTGGPSPGAPPASRRWGSAESSTGPRGPATMKFGYSLGVLTPVGLRRPWRGIMPLRGGPCRAFAQPAGSADGIARRGPRIDAQEGDAAVIGQRAEHQDLAAEAGDPLGREVGHDHDEAADERGGIRVGPRQLGRAAPQAARAEVDRQAVGGPARLGERLGGDDAPDAQVQPLEVGPRRGPGWQEADGSCVMPRRW